MTNHRLFGIVTFLFFSSFFQVFGQTSQQAAQLVQRYKSMASDAEKLARDSRYFDSKTVDLINTMQRQYSSLGEDYQNYINRGGTFTTAQTQEVINASNRISNAMQQLLVNIQNEPQARPRQWNMVVEYKLYQYDVHSSYEGVIVTAASLEEAKEKAMRSIKIKYNWAYVVRAYENR
jgi:hypothetical protein